MSYFSTSAELESAMVTFFNSLLAEPRIRDAFAATGALMCIEYTDPDATIWVDCRTDQPQAWLGRGTGEPAGLRLAMSADDGHRFWLGRLNMTTALATRRVQVAGPVGTLMKLLPVVRQAFPRYREHLERLGRADLAL